MKYKFIEENRSEFRVKKMCQVMDVSQSGYYRWLRKPISNRKTEKQVLQRIIKDLFAKHKGMAGSPMISADLRDFPEYSNVSRQRVAQLMKEMGLRCKTVKKFVVTTDSSLSF
jgi:putative transposase